MKPIRSRSPKVQNNFVNNNYYQSPKRKKINIINIDNNENEINKVNYFNFNYNNNNYYEEITKAFNFITFILKQKDSQIRQLKFKIKDLEKQLHEINENNIMTFNNQDIGYNSSNNSNLKNINNSKIQSAINIIPPEYEPRKISSTLNSLMNTQSDMKNNINNNNNSNIINIYKNNNIDEKNIFDNKINIIHKIKNSTNINKINNYRNDITDIGKNINDYNHIINEDIHNKSLNKNINEHSTDKNNINKIKKELYHSNNNNNINIKSNNGNVKEIKNFEQHNIINERENIIDQSKLKIVTFDNVGHPGSKSNSFNMSDDGNNITSKSDVKNYLKEVKNKLEPNKFKKFITQIKALTKNKNNEQKNIIILQIKNILMDKNLIIKFENIMKVNKNK